MTTQTETTRTIMRCISFPVLKPLAPSGSWDEFGKAINESLGLSMRCLNVMMGALYAADMAVYRDHREEKLHKRPRLNLYQLGVKACPELPVNAVSSLAQSVFRKYTGKNNEGVNTRWACIVGRMSVPSFRGGYIPVKKSDWIKYARIDDGKIILRVPLSRKPTKKTNCKVEWWDIQLATRNEHGFLRRQYAAFKGIMDGELVPGEIKLMRSGRSLMCRISVRMPVVDHGVDPSKQAVVKTDKDFLLNVGVANQDRLWTFNADHLNKVIASYSGKLRRMMDDYKFEPRVDSSGTRVVMSRDALKNNRVVDHHIANAAAWSVNFVVRQKCGSILYDDSCREFMPKFAYHKLKTAIKNRCDMNDIKFSVAH